MTPLPNTPATPPPAPVWDDRSLANPHAAADKRQRVQKMFAAIAPSYDLNNRLHSLWMDQAWRRKAVGLSRLQPDDVVVDVACGTGDLTLEYSRSLQKLREQRNPRPKLALTPISPDIEWAPPPPPTRSLLTPAPQVIGVDFTYEMLPRAVSKVGPRVGSNVSPAGFINGDAQSLPLPDASADVLSIAFGIRNVADPAAAIREFYRVLRPGGRLIILEFSLPTNPVLRGLYNFYFRKILPRTATWISRDKTGAYKYLPESVNTFITRERMQEMMTAAGFGQVEQHPLTFGVCVCYRGVKGGAER